jgi:hypothetical protein
LADPRTGCSPTSGQMAVATVVHQQGPRWGMFVWAHGCMPLLLNETIPSIGGSYGSQSRDVGCHYSSGDGSWWGDNVVE